MTGSKAIPQAKRNPPLDGGRDQLEAILDYYANQPYADSCNETVRVKAVLLATAADEIRNLRAHPHGGWRTDFENAPSPCLGWCTPPSGDVVRQIWRRSYAKGEWTAHSVTQTVKAWQPLPSVSSTGLPASAPHAEVRATARDEMTAAALARIARANLSDPETDDLTVPLAVELAEVQFRLNYMENQYGKIAWDATAPQQDRGK